MLALLRRSRVLALALVLLAPGVSGSAVQWLHACPADAAAAASSHQHHDSGPSDSGHDSTCDCIGACHAAGILSPAKPVTIVAKVGQPNRHVLPPSGASVASIGNPSDLLPPATAPPA
jgi:hypothetical protein